MYFCAFDNRKQAPDQPNSQPFVKRLSNRTIAIVIHPYGCPSAHRRRENVSASTSKHLAQQLDATRTRMAPVSILIVVDFRRSTKKSVDATRGYLNSNHFPLRTVRFGKMLPTMASDAAVSHILTEINASTSERKSPTISVHIPACH